MKTRFWLYYIPCNHELDDAAQQLHYTKALPEDSLPYLAAIYPWELLRQRCLRLHLLFERYARVFYFLYQQNVQMPKKQSLKWKKNVVDFRKRKLIYQLFSNGKKGHDYTTLTMRRCVIRCAPRSIYVSRNWEKTSSSIFIVREWPIAFSVLCFQLRSTRR